MGKIQYVRADEKAAYIKSMGAQTYEALLAMKDSETTVSDALAMSTAFSTASNFKDKRANAPQEANNYVKYLVNNFYPLQQNDLLLKTAYLSIVFANEEYFQSITDLPVEQIAATFNTDVNTVECKLVLDSKLREMTAESAKVIRK